MASQRRSPVVWSLALLLVALVAICLAWLKPAGSSAFAGNARMVQMTAGVSARGVAIRRATARAVDAGDAERKVLIALVKFHQRRGTTQTAGWRSFCDSQAGMNYRVGFADKGALRSFLEQQGVTVPDVDNFDDEHAALVNSITTFGRQGPKHSQAWSSYCDAYNNGNYNPFLSSKAEMKDFLAQHGSMPDEIIELDAKKNALVAKIIELKKDREISRAWKVFSAGPPRGPINPAHRDTDELLTFLAQVTEYSKDELLARLEEVGSGKSVVA